MAASSPYIDEAVTSTVEVNRLRNINTRPGDAQALSLLAAEAAIAIAEGVSSSHTAKLSGSNSIVDQEDFRLGVKWVIDRF
jgi:hypothetical protein